MQIEGTQEVENTNTNSVSIPGQRHITFGVPGLPKEDRSCLTLESWDWWRIFQLDIMEANKEFLTNRAGYTIELKKKKKKYEWKMSQWILRNYMRKRKTSASETFYSPLPMSPPFEQLKCLQFTIEGEGTFQEGWDELCCPLIVSSTRAGRPSVLASTLLILSGTGWVNIQ